MKDKTAKLILKDGTEYEGKSFGGTKSISGEVVFATGMTGYPEALTDPSFRGQILVMTYPLIGNYGVPKKELWESDKIQVSGLIVCNYIDTPSHHAKAITLAEWFKKENVPLLEIKDTRELTKKLRSKGVMLGKILIGNNDIKYEDPNERNLVAEVSTKKILKFGEDKRTVVLLDCGTKRNVARRFMARNLKVVVVPWDTDVTTLPFPFQAVVISNGPGDPKMVQVAISNVRKILKKETPVLGICLGSQILALAAGGTTYKLKFGHRSQNQPVTICSRESLASKPADGRCYLTTQNHGYAVKKIPKGFKEWFRNANDGTNEGIIHESLPFMAVQFHPESSPGPIDTDWIFDYFLKNISNEKK